LQVTHTVFEGSLAPSQFELRSDYPFAVSMPCPPWVAEVAAACDGSRRVADLWEQNASSAGVSKEQFVAGMRSLLSHGFLEVEEFRLPAPMPSTRS
jgi:hypothetical protein